MNYYYVKELYINRKVTVLDQNQKEIGVYHNIKVKVLDSKVTSLITSFLTLFLYYQAKSLKVSIN